MAQHLATTAVVLASSTGASIWALLCGAAALVLITMSSNGIMIRVLATADNDVVRHALRRTVSDAIWFSAAAYAFGLSIRLVLGL